MVTVYYPSLDDAEVVDVEFLTWQGDVRVRKLLVDTGFTGQRSLVLADEDRELVRAELPAARAAGALQGVQNRGWVTCRIPALRFECTLIAIVTDTSPLGLPPNVHGMAGLRFLRQFARWGAERGIGGWRLFLADTVD